MKRNTIGMFYIVHTDTIALVNERKFLSFNHLLWWIDLLVQNEIIFRIEYQPEYEPYQLEFNF